MSVSVGLTITIHHLILLQVPRVGVAGAAAVNNKKKIRDTCTEINFVRQSDFSFT